MLFQELPFNRVLQFLDMLKRALQYLGLFNNALELIDAKVLLVLALAVGYSRF